MERHTRARLRAGCLVAAILLMPLHIALAEPERAGAQSGTAAADAGLTAEDQAAFTAQKWEMLAPDAHGRVSAGGETAAAVPEPGTMALLGLGLAALGAARRRAAKKDD